MLPSGIFNTKIEKDIAIVRTKTQWFLLALLFIIMLVIPQFISDYWLRQTLILFGIYAIAVLGLHILTGLCGQFSIGQAAFMGVGAYTAAIFSTKLGLSGWLTLPFAGIMAGLVGIVFGAPSVRIKGFYLAMATLAAQFIIMWCFANIEWLGWENGSKGLNVSSLELFGVSFRDPVNFYFLVMGLLIVMTFFAKNIQRTKTGRIFIAIRDNELAAEVMGINLFRYKLLAFFIGCFYAGIAGWLLAFYTLRVDTVYFTLSDSIWFLGMLVVGGMGSTTGALLGTAGIRFLDVGVDYFSRQIRDAYPDIGTQYTSGGAMMIFATVVILFMLFEPKGLYHRWEVFKANYRLYPYSY